MSTAATNPMTLSAEQREQIERDGYLVVEELLSTEEVDALRERAREYTHGEREPGGIQIQVEPGVERGEVSVENRGDAIRKASDLVQHDDLFRQLGTHPNIVGVIEQVLGPNLKMFRNDLLLKPPEVGSPKGMHQDSATWPIEPMELFSCWFAIDDATPENGCMRVIPGGHKEGLLPHVRTTDDLVIEPEHYDESKMVIAPIKAGGGLFFYSLLPHYTGPNMSDRWRRAIALSYMSSESTYTGDGAGPEYFHVKGETFPGKVR